MSETEGVKVVRYALVLAAMVAAAGGHLRAEDTKAGTAPAAGAAAAIHQEVELRARPGRVYDALLAAKQFSALSGGLATEIDARAGGAFSCFGGHIIGRNIELVPQQRIVQAWRVVDWPEGVYSIARFELKAEGAGTRLILDHTGFPPEKKEHLAEGWETHYWTPLRTLR